MNFMLLISVVCISAARAQIAFDYQQPSSTWGANCGNQQAMRQTPINIVTADTVENNTLLRELVLDERFDAFLDGTFSNNGLNVRFVADNGDEAAATFRNHLGTYNLANLHFHWGPQDNNGTGHQFDGERFGVEFHFVTIRQGADLSNLGPDTEDGSVAVISVLAEGVDTPISGVWAELDPTMVINAGDVINVSDISWSTFLPTNRDYYYYPGSQTSPGCWEFVHWFVMQDTVAIPSDYIAQLRTTRFDSGELITLNRRNVQPLNDRTVYRYNGAQSHLSAVKPALIMLSVVLAIAFSFY